MDVSVDVESTVTPEVPEVVEPEPEPEPVITKKDRRTSLPPIVKKVRAIVPESIETPP